MKIIAEYTAKDLSALAATLNVAGRSAMKKAELYAEISERLDRCHALALVMDAALYPAETVCEDAKDLARRNGWARIPRRLKKAYKAAEIL